MQVSENDLEMAQNNFGYGRWEAPYWFIGPEQGMGKGAKKDEIRREEEHRRRSVVWRELGSRELNDCRDFHRKLQQFQWHFQDRVRLQSTWRPLMLTLMALQEMDYQKDALRKYQKEMWGATDSNLGKTCVIELSGIASPGLAYSPDTNGLLDTRIRVIRDRISQYKPKLVVMYGLQHKSSWNKIANRSFPDPPNSHFTNGSTVFLLTPHPSRPKCGNRVWGNDDWIKLAEHLRQIYKSLSSEVHNPQVLS